MSLEELDELIALRNAAPGLLAVVAAAQEWRDAVKEASDVMTMIDAQKDALKEIVDRVNEDLEVPKKIFNKMAKTFHKQSYQNVLNDDTTFQLFYETIIEDKA